LLLGLATMLLLPRPAAAQQAPRVFVLPAGESVEIILGDVGREVTSFTVARRGPRDGDFRLLTEDPVQPNPDPFRVREIIGDDYRWVARRTGSIDPESVHRRLTVDDDLTETLALVSRGLRLAMGLGYSDSDVTGGSEYRYRIRLLDYRGETIDTVEQSVTAGPATGPAPPQRVRAEAGDGEVVVEWEYPPYRGGPNDIAVAFSVYRTSDRERERLSDGPVLRVEDYLGYIDREAENGRTYRYEVETLTMAGGTSDVSLSHPVTPRDTDRPRVPRELTATKHEEAVRLTWRISPELDVVGYHVFRARSLSGEYEQINDALVPAGEPRFVDSDVLGGYSYYYKVTAVDDSDNESPRSAVAVLVPADFTPPAKLEALHADVDEEHRSVTLRWTTLDEPDLEGYYVYRGPNRDELARLQATPLSFADAGQPTFTDAGYDEEGLRPGTLVYGIAAVDASYNVGPKTFVEVVVPDNIPPPPPYSFSARLTPDGSVELHWNRRMVTDIAEHRIYRRLHEQFDLVRTVAADADEWTDETAERGETYTYRMSHVDEAGNESEPSEEARVTPTDIGPPAPPPEVVTEEHDAGGILVTWEPSPDDDVTGYRVHRRPYPGGPRRELTGEPIADRRYVDRGGSLANQYGVSAVDSSGNEGEPREQERNDE
jgi:fibronectin type 3 domain-containing protein